MVRLYVGRLEIMPPVGVGVITKLYFLIIAAFKQSMTLNLAQRSFKVMHVSPRVSEL